MYRDEIIKGEERLIINIYKKSDLEKPFVIPEDLNINIEKYLDYKGENVKKIRELSYS